MMLGLSLEAPNQIETSFVIARLATLARVIMPTVVAARRVRA